MEKNRPDRSGTGPIKKNKSMEMMRRRWETIILAVFLLVPVTLHGQKAGARQQGGQDTIVYTVYGMDCPGCESGLEKQINKIPAVQSSTASWVKQQLKVVVKEDSVVDREDILFRVEQANFTLAEESQKAAETGKKRR